MKLYLAFGANIGDCRAAIDEAIRRLGSSLGRLVRRSAFYETRPEGFDSDHLFLNAAALFDTALGAEEILGVTQRVERELGRTCKSCGGRYADRTIDIDLLSLEGERMELPHLVLPHPRLAGRRFVLEPLAEIAPDEVLPGYRDTVASLLRALNRPRIARVERADAATAAVVGQLLGELSGHPRRFGTEDLQRLVGNPSTYIYMVCDETSAPAGMATLCLAHSPTGLKAWVEDVAVFAACRRRGYARALLAHVASEAQRLGAKSLNLTSRPERVEANSLYRSEGFGLRRTNVYRRSFGMPADGRE